MSAKSFHQIMNIADENQSMNDRLQEKLQNIMKRLNSRKHFRLFLRLESIELMLNIKIKMYRNSS